MCKETHEITEEHDQFGVVLKCGHVTTRELSAGLKESYDIHMEIGFPNPSGGWYETMDKDYPLPVEMEKKVKHHPELIEKIRKLLRKEDWKP